MGLTIRDLLEARLRAPLFAVVNRVTATVGVAAQAVLRNDPSRIAFLLVNLSGNTIFLTPLGVPSATNGIRVDANGGNVFVLWEEDGEVTAWEWRAAATAAGSSVFVLEVLIDQGRVQGRAA